MLCCKSSLKTINCFFTSKSLFFKKHIQRGNKDPKHISRAGQHTHTHHPGWFLSLGDIRHGCSSCLPRDSTPGLLPWSTLVLLSWLPFQAAEKWAELSYWFTHWAHPGVYKAFSGSNLAFEVRKFVAESKEKEAEYRDRDSGGWVTPETEPHFPAWQRVGTELNNRDSELLHATETRTLLHIIIFFFTTGYNLFPKIKAKN